MKMLRLPAFLSKAKFVIGSVAYPLPFLALIRSTTRADQTIFTFSRELPVWCSLLLLLVANDGMIQRWSASQHCTLKLQLQAGSKLVLKLGIPV
jgi:hypothetical protein